MKRKIGKRGGGMSTKINAISGKQAEWLKQMEDAYVGKTLLCPYCGHKSAHITFCFFPDNMGYCYAECDDCKVFEPVISRMEKTDKIKVLVKELS